MQIAAKINHEQSIRTVGKKAQHERFRAEDGAIDSTQLRSGKDGIIPPQREEIAVKRVNFSMRLPLAKIELRAAERLLVTGRREHFLNARKCNARELFQERRPAFRNSL
jgi:hypothetical protein